MSKAAFGFESHREAGRVTKNVYCAVYQRNIHVLYSASAGDL